MSENCEAEALIHVFPHYCYKNETILAKKSKTFGHHAVCI